MHFFKHSKGIQIVGTQGSIISILYSFFYLPFVSMVDLPWREWKKKNESKIKNQKCVIESNLYDDIKQARQ